MISFTGLLISIGFSSFETKSEAIEMETQLKKEKVSKHQEVSLTFQCVVLINRIAESLTD